MRFKCSNCDKTFSRKANLTRHQKKENLLCEKCGKKFIFKHELLSHMKNHVPDVVVEEVRNAEDLIQSGKVEILQSAFQRRICTYSIKNNDLENLLILNFLLNELSNIILLLEDGVQKFNCCKFNLILQCIYEMPSSIERQIIGHNSKNVLITRSSNIESELYEVFKEIFSKAQEFTSTGSGWRIIGIDSIEINLVKCQPYKGGKFLKLPKKINQKRATTNIKNDDDYCFIYCIILGLDSVYGNKKFGPP